MRRLLLLCLVALLQVVPAFGQALDLPPDFGPIDWSYVPSEALTSPANRTAVVWLGAVESVVTRAKGEKVTVEWTYRHLAFADPGSKAVASLPVRFRESDSGYFVVNLILTAPPDLADDLKKQFTEAGKYILAAGHVEGAVVSAGHKAAFLASVAMSQADDLGEPAGR